MILSQETRAMYSVFRDWTATNIFLVPLLGIRREKLHENGFENAYINDEIRGMNYENALYLLFRPLKQDKFEDFLCRERERKAKIIDEYDYPDGWTMVVYQYDDKWKNDVKIISSGKYSEVSKEFKLAIPSSRRFQERGVFVEKLTLQHQIMNRDAELVQYWKEELGLAIDPKEDQVWHFYSEREIFSQERLNSLI